MNLEDVEFCPACGVKLVKDDYFPNRLCCKTKNCQFDYIQGK